MPEYILKEDAVAIAEDYRENAGGSASYNRACRHIASQIQALPPVSVEGDLVERLLKYVKGPRRQGNDVMMAREAAQAITVLQGRVEAIREECAKVADEAATNADFFAKGVGLGAVREQSRKTEAEAIAKAIRAMK